MDIRIIGTLGLTEEDVQAIEAVEGIDKAEGAYYAEAFLETDTKGGFPLSAKNVMVSPT